MHAGGGRDFGGEIDGRLAAADMELIRRGEIVGGELVGILAGGNEAGEQRLLQRAVAVMGEDVPFDGHGKGSRPR